MKTRRFQFEVVQDGAMPLTTGGEIHAETEHVCTSVLIWPQDEAPGRHNSVIVDPCFTHRSFAEVQARLQRFGIALGDIGYDFETHDHFDHLAHVPDDAVVPAWQPLSSHPEGPLDGIMRTPCPGHHPSLEALRFMTGEGHTWVVSDAVLDRDWLVKWRYYWPNGYMADEIETTWRSVAWILSEADVIVPGHGPPIAVTRELLAELLAAWPTARYADFCPDVPDVIRRRLESIEAAGH